MFRGIFTNTTFAATIPLDITFKNGQNPSINSPNFPYDLFHIDVQILKPLLNPLNLISSIGLSISWPQVKSIIQCLDGRMDGLIMNANAPSTSNSLSLFKLPIPVAQPWLAAANAWGTKHKFRSLPKYPC